MWINTLYPGGRAIKCILPLNGLSAATFHWIFKYFPFFVVNMNSVQELSLDSNLLLPPSSVYGMKVLDKERFSKTISVPCITAPIESLPNVLKVAKKCLLKMSNLNSITTEDGTCLKRILLDPFKVNDFFLNADKEKSESLLLREEDIKMCEITLTYENWLAEAIFRAVLPSDKEGVSSWSIIGHIIHLNLRDHLLEYKHLIGQVLLDKTPQALTVVNKANMIDTTYRTFQIELLAGESNMLTHVRENHCTYEFDFSKVYWNPRLVGEHERIVKYLNAGDILFDVFAGVGPFAIPAARKQCRVYANDLNPESYKWLLHNIKGNKVMDRVSAFNKDGADFIRNEVKEGLREFCFEGETKNVHITMNLPAMAVEFLGNFRYIFSSEEKPPTFRGPTVHVYCFIKNAEDSSKAAKELVEHHLGTDLGENLKSVTGVRTVSNNKHMMRVSFILSESILFGSEPEDSEPSAKRLCLRDNDEQSC